MRSTSVFRSTLAAVFGVTVLLSAACIIAPVQGCAALNPQGLTRPRARSLLRGHVMFKRPAPLPLSVAEKFPVPAEKADEPEPVERALELFFEDRPVMGVLHHLGLIEATAAAVKRPQRLAYTGYLTMWEFRITPRLTAKGRKAVKAAGGEGEDSVPAFWREVVEITGIRKEGAARAEVEFTWKAVPTEAGEAFDPTSDTFKALPPTLQQKITHMNILGNSLKTSFGEARRATARLQLYDDGWRVEYIR